jgi:hypothetical protein
MRHLPHRRWRKKSKLNSAEKSSLLAGGEGWAGVKKEQQHDSETIRLKPDTAIAYSNRGLVYL